MFKCRQCAYFRVGVGCDYGCEQEENCKHFVPIEPPKKHNAGVGKWQGKKDRNKKRKGV